MIVIVLSSFSVYGRAEQHCTKSNQLYHDPSDSDKVCVLGCKAGKF